MDDRSEKNLNGVHRDLVLLVREAAENPPVPFFIVEGLRTLERQKMLKAEGASWTLKSRHLTGHAVDVVCRDTDGDVSYAWPLYRKLAEHIKAVAILRSVPIIWGGDWPKEKADGPHFELDRKFYP